MTEDIKNYDTITKIQSVLKLRAREILPLKSMNHDVSNVG